MRVKKPAIAETNEINGQMSLFSEEAESAEPSRSGRKRKAGAETETAASDTSKYYDADTFPMNKPESRKATDAPEQKEPRKRRKTNSEEKTEKEQSEKTEAESPAPDENTTLLHWKTGRPDAQGQYLCQAHGLYVILMYFPEGPKDGTQTEPGWYGNYPGKQTVQWHFVMETEITRWAELPENR